MAAISKLLVGPHGFRVDHLENGDVVEWLPAEDVESEDRVNQQHLFEEAFHLGRVGLGEGRKLGDVPVVQHAALGVSRESNAMSASTMMRTSS